MALILFLFSIWSTLQIISNPCCCHNYPFKFHPNLLRSDVTKTDVSSFCFWKYLFWAGSNFQQLVIGCSETQIWLEEENHMCQMLSCLFCRFFAPCLIGTILTFCPMHERAKVTLFHKRRNVERQCAFMKICSDGCFDRYESLISESYQIWQTEWIYENMWWW